MKSYKRYRILSDSLKNAVGFVQRTPEINCIDKNGRSHSVEMLDCEKEKCWNLRSEDGFYLDDSCLQVKISGIFQYPERLFAETGIAPQNAILGVATKWVSKSACVQGIIPWDLDLTEQTSGADAFSMEHIFPVGTLKGALELETFIFMKENHGDSKVFAVDSGSNLGSLEKVVFFLDGNGSEFPVEVMNDPSEPLWKVVIETDDIWDLFCDNIRLVLNEAHPSYAALNIGNGHHGENAPAFNEVMTSAVLLIIQTFLAGDKSGELQDAWNSRSSDYPGTIANALQHFYSICGLDKGMTIEDMHYNIHRYFDREFPVKKSDEKTEKGE